MEKILGSGSGLGRVGVLNSTIEYSRVSFLLSVFPGISGYSSISGYIGYHMFLS